MVEVPNNGEIPDKAGLWLFGVCGIMFNKARALDELYVTKNAIYTKHPIERTLGQPLIANSIVSMETDDPTYKLKRKALSAAFFKSKLSGIVQIVKKTALKVFHDQMQKGEDVEVELNSFTSSLQAHIIISILCGPGHSFKQLDYVDLKTGHVKKVPLSEHFDRIVPDISYRVQMNPFASTASLA